MKTHRRIMAKLVAAAVAASVVLGGLSFVEKASAVEKVPDGEPGPAFPCIAVGSTCNTVSNGQLNLLLVVVTNCGNIALGNITVVDNLYGPIGNIPFLPPGATQPLPPRPTTNPCGSTTNVVTATGFPQSAFTGSGPAIPPVAQAGPPTFCVVTGPPVLNCPSNVTAECTGGLTPVTYTVTAVDSGGNPLPVTCVPPSGGGFRLGPRNGGCRAATRAGPA